MDRRAKWLHRLLVTVAFIIQYAVPIILFGGIVPYTHDEIGAGLTKAGIVAAAILFFFIARKSKEKIKEKPKSLPRALALSAFPIVTWALVLLALNYVKAFAIALSAYWEKTIIFIVAGRAMYTLDEVMTAKEDEDGADR